MIEKYGGPNVHWNGSELITNQNVVLPVSSWFKSHLPESISFEATLWYIILCLEN